MGEIGSISRSWLTEEHTNQEQRKKSWVCSLDLHIDSQKDNLIIQQWTFHIILILLRYSNLPRHLLHPFPSLSSLSIIFLFFPPLPSCLSPTLNPPPICHFCPNWILLCGCPQEDEAVSPGRGLIQFITRLYCNGSSIHVPILLRWCHLWDPLITQLKGRVKRVY